MKGISVKSVAIAVAVLAVAIGAMRSGAQTAKPGARVSMELLDTKIAATNSAIEITGQVKNVSARPVEGVTVHYDFQDASGKSVKREQGPLATDPLAPNKISEFKVSTPYNANIKRFNVTFSQVFGGPLATKDSRKQ